MASEKQYRIIVETDDDVDLGEKPNPEVGASKKFSSVKQWLNYNIKQAESSSNVLYAGIEAVKLAGNLVSQAADATLDSWYSLQEDYIGQNNLNNAKTVVNMVNKVFSSTAQGAMAGMQMGGPVGAAIGAVSGFATSTIGIGLQARATMVDQHRSLENQAYSQYFNGVRYGLIDGGRGTYN